MYKAYIYGAGREYDNFMSLYPYYCSEIQIIAVITTDRQYFDTIDGYNVIRPNEVKASNIDFVIIAIEQWREAFDSLVKSGISPLKIIRSSIFRLPFFDFTKYLRLKKSNITILSNSCIAGRIYNKLALETLSPTKNMYCLGKSFVRFCNNIDYYLKQEIRPLYNNDITEGTVGLEDFFHKGILDDIVWTFNHDEHMENALNKWRSRVEKVNVDNIAVVMIILNDKDIELFDQIKFQKKLGVYYKETDSPHIIYCPTWNEEKIRFQYNSNWISYANQFLESLAKIDWINFLVDGNDYIRTKSIVDN